VPVPGTTPYRQRCQDVGGDINPTPGEISLAHHGVLFLVERHEFKRSVLDDLRQPPEEGRVAISRAAGTMTFPSEFMLVAATNQTRLRTVSSITSGLQVLYSKLIAWWSAETVLRFF
jgi:hypothetical protein